MNEKEEKLFIDGAIQQGYFLAEKEGFDVTSNEYLERVSAIAEDAQHETPTTEAGMIAREAGLAAMKGGVVSPIQLKKNESPKYDMNGYVNAAAVPTLATLLKILGNHEEFKNEAKAGMTDEEVKQLDLAKEKAVLEFFASANENNMPMYYYFGIFNALERLVTFIKSKVESQINGHEADILSRVIGVKHPDTTQNVFVKGFATYKQLTDKVMEIRKEFPDVVSENKVADES